MATASALFSDAAANKTKGRTPSSLLPVRGVPYTTSPIRSVRRIGSEDVRHIPRLPVRNAAEEPSAAKGCAKLGGRLPTANLNLLLGLTERCGDVARSD